LTDDTQLPLSFNHNESYTAVTRLMICLADVRYWMSATFLKPNAHETELILFVNPKMLAKVQRFELKIGESFVWFSAFAWNLVVIFDSILSLK